MSDKRRSLDNPINWSFGIGRLFGIRIRLHLFFIIGALVIIFRDGAGMGVGAAMVGILFLIVLLHEFGHCAGARYVGGHAEEILMWPLGGLASVSVPHNAKANLITAVAGPMVNVVICAVLSVILVLLTGRLSSVPWNPFNPSGVAVGTPVQYWMANVFYISYILLLFNLAPVFPMDGGRVFQCLMWPSRGYHNSTKLATGVGMVGAIGFGVLGIITQNMILLFIAIFGYMTCWQQRQMLKMTAMADDSEFGYDFSKGFGAFEGKSESQPKPGYFARRRAAKEERRREREQAELEEHRRRVDSILQKIARHGADSLTPAERRTLESETERQRAAKQ